MEDPKYINTVNPLVDDQKYTNCHMDEQAIKHHYTTNNNNPTNNSSTGVSSCHSDETDSMTMIKTEDGVSHSYVLPSFLH